MKTRHTLLILSLFVPLPGAAEEPEGPHDKPENALELPDVDVIGVTPLATSGLSPEKVSGNVQSAEDEDIHRHEALDLSDFMRRRLNSVNINEAQGNPFQLDVTYRGYTASPLLGTPIGLSVYQDGVRVNEPFGDTVNWDLIPRAAIANIDVIPGSNPLFGLNTLGGALSVRTKSGFSHAGTRGQLYGGSFGRKNFEFEHGGYKDEVDWFVAGNLFEDDGWRPFSHSAVHQVFGKLGWENETTDFDFSFMYADNKLNGVGPTPADWLSANRRTIYTAPDITENTLYFFQLKGSHEITQHLSLAGNAYYRANTIDTLNSNIGEDCASFLNNTYCLDDANEQIPAAANETTRSVQDGSGVNLQLTSGDKVMGRDNQFMVGGGYNASHTHYLQASQDALFSPLRYTVGTGPFVTGTNIKGENDYFNAFASDVFSVLPWLHLNGSVSWNQAQVRLRDRIGTALNGDHAYERFNPAAGFTINPFKALDIHGPVEDLTVFGNYNEGFRAPTPMELSCADKDAPCTLPNSAVSDPSLKPVVSKTFETGVKGKLGEALQWSLAFYHSRLNNDILFVNSLGSLINGYFQNVGITQRQGAELGLHGVWQKLNWYTNYSFTDATYRTAVQLHNAVGRVDVQPGDRIPGIPRHTVKLGLEYEILDGWFFGGDLQYASSQYLRGDDHNQLPQVKEYVVVNLNSRYAVTNNVEVFAMARNVFDAHYETFGAVNRNFFSGTSSSNHSERFLSPGAPISGWAGIRVRFD